MKKGPKLALLPVVLLIVVVTLPYGFMKLFEVCFTGSCPATYGQAYWLFPFLVPLLVIGAVLTLILLAAYIVPEDKPAKKKKPASKK